MYYPYSAIRTKPSVRTWYYSPVFNFTLTGPAIKYQQYVCVVPQMPYRWLLPVYALPCSTMTTSSFSPCASTELVFSLSCADHNLEYTPPSILSSSS
jgi:hypothetical protein